jgi:intergrase/recombinase
MDRLSRIQARTATNLKSWKTVGVSLEPEDLSTLNQRLQANGFETLADMVRAFIRQEFPSSAKNDSLERLLLRLKEKNIVDPLSGESSLTFYRNIDDEAFKEYLLAKYSSKYALDLFKYFKRFAQLFFTKPTLIKSENGRNRGWICEAVRRFAEFYDYQYQNPELKLVVREIIERYEINKKMRRKDILWIAEENYLDNAIKTLLSAFTGGELAIVVRFALFSGLRGEEMLYVHEKPLCEHLASCNCENLHVIRKPSGYSIILVNRIAGLKRCYFTIIPSRLWEEFRGLPRMDKEIRKFAHDRIKETTAGSVTFMDLRKFHYNVNVRSEMKESGAEVLAGRAKTVSARHYLLNELDLLVEQYRKVWEKYLVINRSS